MVDSRFTALSNAYAGHVLDETSSNWKARYQFHQME